ncbi:MAG: hypothetical protein OXG18_10435 [Gemmatimonadetes bacterium]|nr:hypothetical protein [Gemmatimonadota bacterium]
MAPDPKGVSPDRDSSRRKVEDPVPERITTMHGEGIPELRKSGDRSEAVDLQGVLDAHRRKSP